MARTKHFQSRVNERKITEGMINLVLDYGVPHDDGRVVLNRNAITHAQNVLRCLSKTLYQAQKRDGLIVIKKEDYLITAYNLSTKKKKKFYS